MSDKLKTMKISELITLLKVYQKDLGDVPVFHQRDPEGNAVFIMPYDEYIEDELFTY